MIQPDIIQRILNDNNFECSSNQAIEQDKETAINWLNEQIELIGAG